MSETEPAPTKYHVNRRVFLNRDKTMPAFVIGVVEDTRDIPNDKDEGWWGAIVELIISDCTRRVRFDLSLDTPTERAEALRKINLLAQVISAVRDAIELEVESLNARPKLPEDDGQQRRIDRWASIISNGIDAHFVRPKTKLKAKKKIALAR